MIVTIHQPEHLPWLGFFDKVRQADVYVILDNTQFRKNYFQNRNKIRTKSGWSWVVIPVLKDPTETLINEILTADKPRLKRKYVNLIGQHYFHAEFFETYFPPLKQILERNHVKLVDLNIELIKFLLKELGIETDILVASELGLPKAKGGTEVNFDICKKLDADVYLSGISGKEYLDESKFAESGIKVMYQEFYHPIYQQLYEPFIPCMSVIDLLFNHGKSSLEIMKGIGVRRMDKLFL